MLLKQNEELNNYILNLNIRATAKDFGIQVQQEDTLNLPTRDSKETLLWI